MKHPLLTRLLAAAEDAGASDLHLRSGLAPVLRVHGELRRCDSDEALSSAAIIDVLSAAMPPAAIAEFEERRDADFAYEAVSGRRYRVNAFHDHAGPAAVFRLVPSEIPSADALGFSPEMRELCALRRGLVVVTGPTGSGKSTTLAAMVDLINRTRADHILTIEDPIEFVHHHRSCVVTQREVGRHTRSFKVALRAALREDPDVVMIGEMRDLETVSIALETAETGHLVLATLHTNTAVSTIDRIIDQFTAEHQDQVRTMLAGSLRAVIAQALCRKRHGGRVAAREVLFNTPAIANLIRERRLFQVQSIMQTSRRLGMITLGESLAELVVSGEIEVGEAMRHAADASALAQVLRSRGIDVAPDAREALSAGVST